MHSLILPMVVLDFASEANKNTYLGLMTFTGLIIAMLAQPVTGAVSDRTTARWGRRRPFIFGGVIGMLLLLPVIGMATTFAMLFTGYCLLQLASNVTQGPYQAFIPEMVPENKRGRASGVKSFMKSWVEPPCFRCRDLWIAMHQPVKKAGLAVTWFDRGYYFTAYAVYRSRCQGTAASKSQEKQLATAFYQSLASTSNPIKDLYGFCFPPGVFMG